MTVRMKLEVASRREKVAKNVSKHELEENKC
jgi:hypothetical protein